MASNASGRFRFEAATHEYFVGRRRLPSITQVLSATSDSSSMKYWTEESSLRGRRIHEATARFDLGGGWGENLIEADVPRIHAYAQFLSSMVPIYDEIEQPRYSKQWEFAGTPDRVGRFRDGRRFVLDLKTGLSCPDHGLQTAAQVLVLDEKPDARDRYTLELRDDGTFRLIPWRDRTDYWLFLARLQRYNDPTEGGPRVRR